MIVTFGKIARLSGQNRGKLEHLLRSKKPIGSDLHNYHVTYST